jgi:transposase
VAVNGNLEAQQCLTQQINMIEALLKTQLKLAPEFIQLTSIDGIGLILALTIMLETGDIKRFSQGVTTAPTAVVSVAPGTVMARKR